MRSTSENLSDYLGKKKYRYDIIKGETEVGVTTGLAWTIVGGDTLFIETTVVPGTGKLVLTGQLGEVMQESAKAGISYIDLLRESLELKRTSTRRRICIFIFLREQLQRTVRQRVLQCARL